jgi:hypothetical protein
MAVYSLFNSELPKHEESHLIGTSPPIPQSIQNTVTPSAPSTSTEPSKTAEVMIHHNRITLPYLANSDKFVFDAINSLIQNHSLIKLFYAERIIRDIVITMINLTQPRVPVKDMPFKPPTGNFITYSLGDQLVISPDNKQRYINYIKIAEAVDTKQLVDLYIELYPLLQQQYKELGYPNQKFNELLIKTIDDLLDAPDIKDPIHLLQPIYFYKFEDVDLEDLSIGQKIMIRLGIKYEWLVKIKLTDIKKELNMRSSELMNLK